MWTSSNVPRAPTRAFSLESETFLLFPFELPHSLFALLLFCRFVVHHSLTPPFQLCPFFPSTSVQRLFTQSAVEQLKIKIGPLGHSLVRLLVRRPPICLLRTANLTRALRCAHSFTHLLPSSRVCFFTSFRVSE